jgi:signal transduction histidine kinase
MSLSGSFLQSDDKPHNEIVVVCREMSARQEIERMKELEKLKTDFMSSITHDLKAPLTSIIGYADLLLETSKEGMTAEEIEYVSIIKQEGVRLTRMINDILNATRIEYGRLQLSPEQVFLKDIIEEVVKKFGIHKDKFNFTVTADSSLPQLWLDRELIERVFMNLVSNAVKYSPDGGSIKVDIYVQGQNVRVDVIDSGIGLSPESLSHIFEKFFRVRSEATKGIGGTGLGLVIVKGIVEAHGGSMTVSSTHGQGSIFSVILPLALERHKP